MTDGAPDDEELLERSIEGFGETVAALARWGVGAQAELRRPGVLGGRIEVAGEHPWFNAAVVPPDVAPERNLRAARRSAPRPARAGARPAGRGPLRVRRDDLPDRRGREHQYVATEAGHRRRGLAAGLLTTVLAQARADGMQTATLQASPDGLSVYERMGFRRLATLRAFVRPA